MKANRRGVQVGPTLCIAFNLFFCKVGMVGIEGGNEIWNRANEAVGRFVGGVWDLCLKFCSL